MRISPINNISFKKVIRLNSSTCPIYADGQKSFKLDSSTREVLNALNRRKTKAYTNDEAKEIRNFFQNNISDYKPKSKVIIKNIYNRLYMITGNDIKTLKELEEKVPNYIGNPDDELSIQRKEAQRQVRQFLADKSNENKDEQIKFDSSTLDKSALSYEQITGDKPIISRHNIFTYSNKNSDNDIISSCLYI